MYCFTIGAWLCGQLLSVSLCFVHAQMLEMVRAGLYSDRHGQGDFLGQLRRKLDEFTDNFLPHMKEEEEIFQPLLMKYFAYDELRELKQDVLQNHHLSEKVDLPEKTEPLPEPVPEPLPEPVPAPQCAVEPVPVPRLPPELLTLIFSHLRPPDRAACAAVCRQWRSASLAPRLWKDLSPAAPAGERLGTDRNFQTQRTAKGNGARDIVEHSLGKKCIGSYSSSQRNVEGKVTTRRLLLVVF